VKATSVITDGAHFEFGRLAFVSPVRTAIVVASLAAVALSLGEARFIFPLVAGALLVGISDPQETTPVRVRTLATATVWFALATALGGLVGGAPLAHVAVGAVLAFVCGYVGVLGPRAALMGMFALVIFLAFSGGPATPAAAVRDGAMVLAGGGVQVMVVMLLGLAGRDSGTRAAVANAFRYLAVDSLRGRLTVPIVAQAFAQAQNVAQRTVAGDAMRVWLVDLTNEAQQARLGLLALSRPARRPRSDAAGSDAPDAAEASIDEVRLAAADLSRQVARVLVLPWRRRGVAVRVERLNEALRRADTMGHLDPTVLAAIVDPLVAAAQAVAGPWPWHRRPVVQRIMAVVSPTVTSAPLRQRLAPSPMFTNHAIRLAIAVAVGIVFSRFVDLPHSFWLPLTVAWVARPDLGSTISLVTFRVIGTLVGAAAIAAVVVATDLSTVGLAVLIGLGTVVACSFITVNYSVGVLGLTTILLTLLASLGEPVERDFVLRAFATIAGGVLVVAVAMVKPQRAGGNAAGALADVADRLRQYAGAIASTDPVAIEAGRHDVQGVHGPAHVAVVAVEHEPGRYALAARPARQVLIDLEGITAQLSYADLASSGPSVAPTAVVATVAIDDNVMTGLKSLALRLRAVQAGQSVPPRTGPAVDGPAGRHLDAAHRAVDSTTTTHR
jgi:uncharacterized membrane protein YccC